MGNGGGNAMIFNTFQCYLKETRAKVAEHISYSEREGWEFAAKAVRGAYMVLERERAETMGYDSPIHDTVEDTHACYHDVIDTIMQRDVVASNRSKANLLVASHNQQSIEYVLERMRQNGVSPSDGCIYFG